MLKADLQNLTVVAKTNIVIMPSLVTCQKARCPNGYQKMLPALKVDGYKSYLFAPGPECENCSHREDRWQLVLDLVPEHRH